MRIVLSDDGVDDVGHPHIGQRHLPVSVTLMVKVTFLPFFTVTRLGVLSIEMLPTVHSPV